MLENLIIEFFAPVMSWMDEFELFWYQKEASFLYFRKKEKFYGFRASKPLKILSKKCEICPFSCRGSKVVLLKMILSLNKRPTAISVRFFWFIFDVLYNHTKSKIWLLPRLIPLCTAAVAYFSSTLYTNLVLGFGGVCCWERRYFHADQQLKLGLRAVRTDLYIKLYILYIIKSCRA